MSEELKWISDGIDGIYEDMRSFREELHRHPELSSEEVWTSSQIIKKLEEFGIPYERAGKTSVLATIKGDKPGKTVALRGDMDGLPIEEASDVKFKSEEKGKMHACGHDSHSTTLLAAGKILNEHKNEINGTVKLFFQEAEETFEGAKRIIEDGKLDAVDAIFGLHNNTSFPLGKAFISRGSVCAGCDTIYVTFTGVSGHGSTPYLAKDSLLPACTFLLDINGIITKNTDAQKSIVVSVGKMVGGTKANIVAKETKLDISLRYFDEETHEIVLKAMERHAKAIGSMYELDVDFEVVPSTPSLTSDANMADIARNAAVKVMGADALMEHEALMGSEDFAYYLQKTKGAYLWFGSGNDTDCTYFMHNEKFKLEEEYMRNAAKVLIQTAVDFLNE
ncbi:MAG: amidohydrolase [Lachnospiraceae bacterium]|jgi:amidohydrolase|nr:amidohydrolase [Lachnospiraceae bacterium]